MSDAVTSERLEQIRDGLEGLDELTFQSVDEMRSITTELLARRHPPTDGGEVKVKDLVWVDRGEIILPRYKAEALGGYYYADLSRGGRFYWASSFASERQEFETLELAKAAAQADFNARILSALSQPVTGEGWVLVPVEPTEAMMQAWLGPLSFAGSYRAMLAAAPILTAVPSRPIRWWTRTFTEPQFPAVTPFAPPSKPLR